MKVSKTFDYCLSNKMKLGLALIASAFATKCYVCDGDATKLDSCKATKDLQQVDCEGQCYTIQERISSPDLNHFCL